jgi:tRNA A37 threonylcarbamoyladenosine synthetase subunit TsaC/SUA5/YrdC
MFGKALDMVVDGGPILAEHSSIIDFTADQPVIVRRGKGNVDFITEEE